MTFIYNISMALIRRTWEMSLIRISWKITPEHDVIQSFAEYLYCMPRRWNKIHAHHLKKIRAMGVNESSLFWKSNYSVVGYIIPLKRCCIQWAHSDNCISLGDLKSWKYLRTKISLGQGPHPVWSSKNPLTAFRNWWGFSEWTQCPAPWIVMILDSGKRKLISASCDSLQRDP